MPIFDIRLAAIESHSNPVFSLNHTCSLAQMSPDPDDRGAAIYLMGEFDYPEG
jgi:hypothetical protein